MKNHIPNIITLFNMLSGILSIYSVMNGNIELAAYLIFVAAVFDFLDGMAARLLNAKSEIGIELDSLADVVSFGVAPGFILFHMISISHGLPVDSANDFTVIPFIAFIVPAFAALRLAKFNIDKEQTNSFRGLPTPALAILIASLPLIRTYLYDDREFFYMIITNTYFLLTIAIIGSLLMVSRFPLFALKFNGFGLKSNLTQYIFIGVAVILLLLLNVVAIPFIILFYLFLSLIIFLVDMQ
ncbi:MAG: CDP-diacylglycerol--serine O-phosphatidyltransferase [Bacteroidetes bacterium]|nr:CDP-diacylglycerol--serine O-phosphatidyltransferase [Bacteroidota bacterium]MBL6943603.1 CDP-diacylglycerol--serine O-phosphatidyltransferase [Bacteroidales bacterium]